MHQVEGGALAVSTRHLAYVSAHSVQAPTPELVARTSSTLSRLPVRA